MHKKWALCKPIFSNVINVFKLYINLLQQINALKIWIVLFILGQEAVDKWYGEIKDYNFSSPGHQPKTGKNTIGNK